MTENVEEVEDKGDTAEEGDDDTWEGVWGQAHRLSRERKDQQKTKSPPEELSSAFQSSSSSSSVTSSLSPH